MRLTLFGRVMKFLFQAPVLTMNTSTGQKIASYRFIPAMAGRGFVVTPILLSNDDLMLYCQGEAGSRAESISFSRPASAWGQLSDNI